LSQRERKILQDLRQLQNIRFDEIIFIGDPIEEEIGY
jgi:hypothetical protein